MNSAVKRKMDREEPAPIYRNRTAACLLPCRCHDLGETGRCEAAHNRQDSIFLFCKSSRHRTDFDQAVL